MSMIDFANKYIYRPNFEEVGYGESSYGILVVTNDPYVFSKPRWSIYITIALGIVASLYILLKVYNKTSTSTFGEPLFAPDVQIKRKWLTLLSCLSIIASGVHHIDNFLRVDQYFLPAGIYNGFFFILDVGLANWVIAAFLLTIGVAHILRNSTYYFAQYNSRVYFDRHHIVLYAVYIHCVMIWSGQMHYSIESFYNFSSASNISILLEGWSAIALNMYVIYLHCFVFVNTPAAVEDVDKENSSSHEKASLMEKRSELDDEYSATDNRTDGDVEMKKNIMRRRSK
eukprot:gene12411-14363_t